VLTRVAHAIQAAQPPPDAAGVPDAPPAATTPATRALREHAAIEARRQARYDRVVALHREGHSLREVARRAGVCRNTVRRYLDAGAYVACAKRARRPRGCDVYATYLRERWEAGERNSAALLAELRARGYTGAASTLRQYVATWRPAPRRPGRRPAAASSVSAPPRRRAFSPRQTRRILLRPVKDLDSQERDYRAALCQDSATIATAQALVADFTRMVRERARDDLERWLEAAGRSAIPELVSFVNGVRRDYEAVAAALTSPHSQGQTEGQVNRLKLLKRQSYGRVNFDLLRRQLLYRAA